MFRDRVAAGRALARSVRHLAGRDVVVLGLPRGGVPIAAQVAASLGAPLDVIVVRKLGVPFQPELAMGAIGEDGVRVVNDEVVRATRVSERDLADVERRERAELARRAERFRAVRSRVPLDGRTAVIVDDGIATGSTARAACLVARAHGADRVVLAVPVAPTDWAERLAGVADEYVAVETPTYFAAVGQFYEDFRPTTDDEVVSLLRAQPVAVDDPPVRDGDVAVDADGVTLAGQLTVPERAIGVVVFAHGSGSSRHSPRNRHVAGVLQRAGMATLLLDLLTESEERDRGNVFDIELLAGRLLGVVRWLDGLDELAELPVGYFGASTGAGAALWAAADPEADVAAVVSRGGRPDLAMQRLDGVRAPTLLVVGERDRTVLDLNRHALAAMRCEAELATVPGATHLFEEPGTLDAAAELARNWFVRWFDGVDGRASSAGSSG